MTVMRNALPYHLTLSAQQVSASARTGTTLRQTEPDVSVSSSTRPDVLPTISV